MLASVVALVIAPFGMFVGSRQRPVPAGGTTPAIVDAQAGCSPTVPNGQTPPGERPSADHHGNGALWTALWTDGTVVFRPGGPGFVLTDGALQMKFPWWLGVRGSLTINGRRLDAPAPPLRTRLPSGYGDSGFHATSLIFPTPGCWEVTGRVGEVSLTFVVVVVKIGEGPVQNGLPPGTAQQRLQPARPHRRVRRS